LFLQQKYFDQVRLRVTTAATGNALSSIAERWML
jgi:hypothetical protein